MADLKTICWDLDETLGMFRNIISARSGGAFPNPEDSYKLRTDLIKTLNRMIEKGYRHVITSSAKRDYSEKVVAAVCLDAYFEHIFGRNDVTEGVWGKQYLPVANMYRLEKEKARESMLVVANMPSDEPVDIDIVFVHDQRPIEETALAYETIAERLWELGDGSFLRGFEALIDSGKRIACLDKDFEFQMVSAWITDNISVEMGYKNSPCTDGLKIPTIMNVRHF